MLVGETLRLLDISEQSVEGVVLHLIAFQLEIPCHGSHDCPADGISLLLECLNLHCAILIREIHDFCNPETLSEPFCMDVVENNAFILVQLHLFLLELQVYSESALCDEQEMPLI